MKKSSPDNFEIFPNRRSKYISLVSMSVLVVAIGLLLTYALPHILPKGTPPASTPAPTGTPTLATAPAPTATPTPALLVATATLSGKQDATGILTEDIQVWSREGLAVLTLSKGTKVLDVKGQPLSAITVTTKSSPLRTDIAFVGSTYEFGPTGATLDPPASLTIRYNPSAYYPFDYQTQPSTFRFQEIDISQVYMTYFGDKGPIRPALTSSPRSAASVTAKIDHLDTFILYCEVSGYMATPSP